eukprot:gene13011-14349_t
MAANESCNEQSDTPPAMGRQEALDRFSKLEDSMAQIVSLLSSGPGTGSLPDSNEGRPGSSTSTGRVSQALLAQQSPVDPATAPAFIQVTSQPKEVLSLPHMSVSASAPSSSAEAVLGQITQSVLPQPAARSEMLMSLCYRYVLGHAQAFQRLVRRLGPLPGLICCVSTLAELRRSLGSPVFVEPLALCLCRSCSVSSLLCGGFIFLTPASLSSMA